MNQSTVFKCACCGRTSEVYSRPVKQSLGQYICLHCEIEREYEIEAMQQARDNQ